MTEVGTDPPVHTQPTEQIADEMWKRVEPELITLHRIHGVFALSIVGGLTLGLLIAGLFMDWFAGQWRWAAMLGWLALTAWLLWLAVWYPLLWYRHLRYKITSHGVEIRWGVWWRHVANVPHSRVQHTDVTQGPLQRYLGLGTLLIHTAGTQNHTVDLAGLAHDRAMRIRNYLLKESARHFSTEHQSTESAVHAESSHTGESAHDAAAYRQGQESPDREQSSSQYE